ncbi:MAG: hypothetical protein U0263_35045 [Polyangiaceae bacterium]
MPVGPKSRSTYHPPLGSSSARTSPKTRSCSQTGKRESLASTVRAPSSIARLRRSRGSRRAFDELVQSLDGKADATAQAISAKLEHKVASRIPSLIGGSADLAESCKTHIKDGGDVQHGAWSGRNLNFGIREHGMGAIVNGLALSGFFVPFGSTFLVFSDYMRPSVRLSALMQQRTLWIYTHDSVLLGEDGPTHQPIEHVAALRLIPNLDVVRPADGLECAAAWFHAVSRVDGPTALILTRQKTALLARSAAFDAREILKGAYILDDVADPELVFVATGSEVGVAVEAKKLLSSEFRVRVVSAPCWEAFLRQPASEQERVLGRGIPRVTLEAGRTSLWQGVALDTGLAIGLDRFGASAPAERLADEFGLTAARVAARIRARFAG